MKKLLKSKKAGEGLPWWFSLMTIAAVFLLVWLLISGKVFSGFSEDVTKKAIEQKLDVCKLKYEKSISEGVPLPDKDNDGLPDSCDNCPNTPNLGEYVEDKDGDLFPAPKENSNLPICCGNDGAGNNDLKITGNDCETMENDKVYGPKKLILAYTSPKKS